MHHFIYPSQDTYISSRPEFINKNFGIDELLQVGTSNLLTRALMPTKDYVFVSIIFNDYPVQSYTGIFTGSLKGTSVESYGTLIGVSQLTASYFSGSIDGNPIAEYNGIVSGSLNGLLTSSFDTNNTWISIFTGQLTGSSGCLYGTGSGIDTRQENNWQTAITKYVDRSLLKFDLATVSSSIANGSIPTPHFHLKMKVCLEEELPISYTIYALPISQSWNMGNGYFSDGGSSDGVNWVYRDFDLSTSWYSTYTSSLRPDIDYISYPSRATQSFAYGGGTWYTSSIPASQTFNYEVSDIDMDVTDIVISWISGSIPNEGFLIVSSDEMQSTGSGFILKFYSRDTNTIYSPYLDVMWPGNTFSGVGGSGDSEFDTGSIYFVGATIATASVGIKTFMQSGSSIVIPGGINGIFSGSTFFTTSIGDLYTVSMSGIVDGWGLSGNIKDMPILGGYLGTITSNLNLITGPCGNSFSASFVTASFINGLFSGSIFTAYYTDDQKLENAHLTGSWNSDVLLGTYVWIPLPSGIDPYAYAYISGAFVWGKALGVYILSGSSSGSFSGQFINGPLIGGYISAQLSGSIYTSSYEYTSSIEYSSSVLSALDVAKPFSVVLQNVRPTYKAGDIVKFGVFGRSQFPLKTFGIATQQQQYLVPEYLPTSSYYALKDNETGEIIMNFDNYTQISCEYPYGNYFVIDTSGLPQERYYRVLIRVEDEGLVITTDTGKTFKITR